VHQIVPPIEPRATPINSLKECLAVIREELNKQMRETFDTDLQSKSCVYQKPYPSYFYSFAYPIGCRILDFVKFNSEDSKTTWEHVSQYLVQLGEASLVDVLNVRLFSLSLTQTAFSWLSSLSTISICSWEQLEHKFYDHFYSANNELKLSDWTSVRQGYDESALDYIIWFREIKKTM
jgi:hypothetical protein